MFNIIVPVSKAHLPVLPRAIDSIKAQLVDDFQVIVIGDGFVPKVKEDSRFRFYGTSFEEKIWGTTPRNEALKYVDVDRPYLCYLDADNEWLPIHLTTCKALMRSAEISCTGFYAVDSMNNVCSVTSKELRQGRIDTNGMCIDLTTVGADEVWWEKEYIHDFTLFRELAHTHKYVVSDICTYTYYCPDARVFLQHSPLRIMKKRHE